MLPRRRGLELSSLEKCVRDYLEVNPGVVEKRRHYPLLKILNFMRDDLGLPSFEDILKQDIRRLIVTLQKWVNKRVAETSVKTIRYELYLIRSFLLFHDVEIPYRKIKVPRKAAKTRIDRIPSVGELQKLISFSRSPRMRLAIMTLALTGLRLNECLSMRREHVDLERGFITVPPENDKNGVGRQVPIPTELKNEFKHYFGKHFPFEKGFIFCTRNNPEKKLPRNRFYELYYGLLRRAGLDARTPDGSAYVLHPHVYRKFYRTTLEGAGVNKLMIDLWIGHNSGVEKHYYLPTQEMIKKEFEKADQVLRIFGRQITETEDIEELKLRLEIMEAELNKLGVFIKFVGQYELPEGMTLHKLDRRLHEMGYKRKILRRARKNDE